MRFSSLCHSIHNAIRWVLASHWLLTFGVMCLSALGFGVLSADLFMFLKTNYNFLRANGVMGLMDKHLEQMAVVLFYGVVSLGFYLVFKACEKVLVERLLK